ncbi:mechanosensitive ion channel family protein [Microbaculum marinum]|uniref:Mechanosensitive ion channel family protein n=1 Tax=Microbaculum marinum TaxID=1764581 RepID=A0AAW9S113_9HYPH
MTAPQPALAQEQPLDSVDLFLLSPPDLSSPRATLQTLRRNVQEAYVNLIEAYEIHRETPGFGTAPEVTELVKEAELRLRRAVDTLDLSEVPSVNRERVGTETVLLLKEILDRLPVPPYNEIPDYVTVSAAPKSHPLTQWTLPYSDITIVRIDEGPNAGKFLFSAETVALAKETYGVVRGYLERNDANEDFFEFYTLTPGQLLPPKWYLWIEDLPDWTRYQYEGQTVWQWVGLALVLAIGAGMVLTLRQMLRRRAESVLATRRYARRMILPIAVIALSLLAVIIIDLHLNITGWPFVVVNTVLFAVSYLAGSWLVYLAFLTFAEWVITSPRIDPAGIDASMLRIGARILGIAAGIALLFYGATEVGLPVYGVVAGLGVGGLALGLAARPTLENLIGGLILYADRPVRVGDFCQFGSHVGTVEEIGLRSTRIRALDRTLITVPNAEFSNKELINFNRRDKTFMRFDVSLRYETTPEILHTVLDGLRKLLREHPDVDADTVRVRLHRLGAYSIDIEIYAFIQKSAYADFLEVQEQILFQIMELVVASGAEFAFPSSTVYHETGQERRDLTAMSGASPARPFDR